MRTLRALTPAAAKRLHADAMHRLRWRRGPIARVQRKFVEQHGLRVQTGPFEGMTYPRSAISRSEQLVPKLLGSYEQELHGALEQMLAHDWRQVIDVGAADGYYAVGLARRCPKASIHAYEMNSLPAHYSRQLARANGVDDRVSMHGECRIEDLAALPQVPSLFVADCEGAEAILLDPAAVPLLAESALVVELHEWLTPSIETTIKLRFRETHRLVFIKPEPRHAAEYPAVASIDELSYVEQELVVSEFRLRPVRWAVLWPLSEAIA